MPVGAGLGLAAGATLLGGRDARRGADRAAQAGVESSREQIELAREIYGQQREDIEPWRQMGLQALNQLGGLYGFDPVSTPQQAQPPPNPAAEGVAQIPFHDLGRELQQLQQQRLQRALQARLSGNSLRQIFEGGANVSFDDLDEQIAAIQSRIEAGPAEVVTDRALRLNQEQAAQTDGVTQEPMALDQFMDRFRESPDYQFALQEGQRALDRSAAARGQLFSGATGREVTRYGQGMATQNLNNYLNRLGSIAGVGQTATNQLGAAGQQFGTQAGAAAQQAGAARASGYLGRAQAQQQMYGGLGQVGGLLAFGDFF